MNASDITKANQNKILFAAYNNPTVFQSKTYSTIQTVSSFFAGISSGVNLYVSSVVSTVQTCNLYTSPPHFISYAMANNVDNGAYACGAKSVSLMKFDNNVQSNEVATTVISSMVTGPSVPVPISYRITSTAINVATATPSINSLLVYNQGPYAKPN